MELYYTPAKSIFSNYLRISGPEAHHILRVMRYKIGDLLYVTDGLGNEYQTIIKKIQDKTIEATIVNRTSNAREPIRKITLAQSIIKGNHFDFIVEKVTELGIQKIIPFISERTIASISDKKLERYQKIVLAAMKSSMRTYLPSITKPIKFSQLLTLFNSYDKVIFAYEEETAKKINDITFNDFIRNILLVIGPEGGFGKEEVIQAINLNAEIVSLGVRRLRAETAAVSALAILLAKLNEM